MLRPVAMLRLDALLLEQDVRPVLRELGRRGVLELKRATDDVREGADRTVEIARCDGLLERLAVVKRELTPEPVPVADTRDAAFDFDAIATRLIAIEQQAATLRGEREGCMARRKAATELRDQLSGFEDLDLPLDLPGRSAFLHFVIGTLPVDEVAAFRRDAGTHALLIDGPRDDGRSAVIAVVASPAGAELDRIAKNSGLQPVTLPATRTNTAAVLAVTDDRLAELDAERARLVASESRTLAELEKTLLSERRMLAAEQELSRTTATARLTGWMPADETAPASQRIRELTRDRCVVRFTEPTAGESAEVPVLLRAPRWIEPFTVLVTSYGYPMYGELAPTIFLALTYLLMFGLMFGDVGHGAILAIGGLTLRRFSRADRVRSAGLLLLYAGLSSIAFGLVYGSYFGLPALHRFALWRDPIEGDPMRLMAVTIGFGVVVISLGLVLNIVNRLSRGDVLGGIMDKFGLAGLAFYWGALALLAKGTALAAGGLLGWAVVVLLLAPMSCWLLKEPLELIRERRAHGGHSDGGLAMAWAESAVGTFEGVLTYLANTISFVRLAAYAMSHAALLLAFFLMAGAVRHASLTGSVLIVIAGNALVILLEGVIAAVQALRLEYYEFFGKFYSGAGRPFRPFVLATEPPGG